MAERELFVTLLNGHDTARNWKTNDPVLLDGEMVVESDTGKIKVGNGVDTYNLLPYCNVIPDEFEQNIKVMTNEEIEKIIGGN